MNATNATTTRTAKNEAGVKFSLPASWPTASDFRDMAFGASVFADLLKFCQNTIKAGRSISDRDRALLWEQVEETFLAANGATWREMLAELREMLASAPEQTTAKAYPDCLPEMSELEAIYYDAGKFRPVSKSVYCQLFKGAASSRRHGVPWQVWGQRATAAGFARGLVALIASRAYSMGNADLLKVGA